MHLSTKRQIGGTYLLLKAFSRLRLQLWFVALLSLLTPNRTNSYGQAQRMAPLRFALRIISRLKGETRGWVVVLGACLKTLFGSKYRDWESLEQFNYSSSSVVAIIFWPQKRNCSSVKSSRILFVYSAGWRLKRQVISSGDVLHRLRCGRNVQEPSERVLSLRVIFWTFFIISALE
jgi:hypothetical protein